MSPRCITADWFNCRIGVSCGFFFFSPKSTRVDWEIRRRWMMNERGCLNMFICWIIGCLFVSCIRVTEGKAESGGDEGALRNDMAKGSYLLLSPPPQLLRIDLPFLLLLLYPLPPTPYPPYPSLSLSYLPPYPPPLPFPAPLLPSPPSPCPVPLRHPPPPLFTIAGCKTTVL